MDSKQIENCLFSKKISKRYFLGVFPIDKLPLRRIKRPCSIVCNTDPSHKEGKHWVAIFLPKFGKVEYFDSFGIKPTNEEIYEFISKNGKEYKYNSRQIQSNKSTTCGKFCILFILFRSRNLKYNDFINLFINDKSFNEFYVQTIFNKFFDNLNI